MSEHLHGSESYYLERIDATIERFAERVDEVIGNQNNDVSRLLDGMRELLNLEHEAMVMLRDTIRQRDNEQQEQRDNKMIMVLYDVVKFSRSPDTVEDFIMRLDSQPLLLLGNALKVFLTKIVKETEKRAKALKETAELVKQDESKIL